MFCIKTEYEALERVGLSSDVVVFARKESGRSCKQQDSSSGPPKDRNLHAVRVITKMKPELILYTRCIKMRSPQLSGFEHRGWQVGVVQIFHFHKQG